MGYDRYDYLRTIAVGMPVVIRDIAGVAAVCDQNTVFLFEKIRKKLTYLFFHQIPDGAAGDGDELISVCDQRGVSENFDC